MGALHTQIQITGTVDNDTDVQCSINNCTGYLICSMKSNTKMNVVNQVVKPASFVMLRHRNPSV